MSRRYVIIWGLFACNVIQISSTSYPQLSSHNLRWGWWCRRLIWWQPANQQPTSMLILCPLVAERVKMMKGGLISVFILSSRRVNSKRHTGRHLTPAKDRIPCLPDTPYKSWVFITLERWNCDRIMKISKFSSLPDFLHSSSFHFPVMKRRLVIGCPYRYSVFFF